MAQLPLTLRRRKRVEYERLVDLGGFEGDPVELIGGQPGVAGPPGRRPAPAVRPADAADPRAAPPPRPALALEVADASLAFDREYKGSL